MCNAVATVLFGIFGSICQSYNGGSWSYFRYWMQGMSILATRFWPMFIALHICATVGVGGCFVERLFHQRTPVLLIGTMAPCFLMGLVFATEGDLHGRNPALDSECWFVGPPVSRMAVYPLGDKCPESQHRPTQPAIILWQPPHHRNV